MSIFGTSKADNNEARNDALGILLGLEIDKYINEHRISSYKKARERDDRDLYNMMRAYQNLTGRKHNKESSTWCEWEKY